MAEQQFPSIIYKVLLYGCIAAAMIYAFIPNDLIPDAAGAVFGVGALVGYLDDAIVILGAVYAFHKYGGFAFPKDAKGKRHISWKLFIPATLITAFTLWYVFSGVDIIADLIPGIGYVDDAIVILSGIVLVAKLRQRFSPRQKA